MRSLNLDQLRALTTVAELGSFSAAARQLNLTQPAISQQVRELERRYGVQLIERLGKHAYATAPGRALIEAAQRIASACEDADNAMRRFRNGWIGRVNIATTNTVLMYELPPVLRRLSKEHPGIDLHIRNLPTRESVDAVLSNAVDVALVTLPVDARQLKVTPLKKEQLVAILPSDTPDAPAVVTPAWIAGQALLLEHNRAAVHDLVRRWLAAARVSPRVPMHLGTIEGLKSAVASNLGVSIVPEMALSVAVDGIIVRPLDPPIERTLALIEHASKPDERALGIVREALLALQRPHG